MVPVIYNKKSLDIKEHIKDDMDPFSSGKKIIHIKEGSLVKFSNPIPMGGKNGWAPRGAFTTTLDRIKKNKKTRELSLKSK